MSVERVGGQQIGFVCSFLELKSNGSQCSVGMSVVVLNIYGQGFFEREKRDPGGEAGNGSLHFGYTETAFK